LLFEASFMGHDGMVRDLIAAGANLNLRDCTGNTPLLGASIMGHTDVVQCLIEKGSDCNSTNTDGISPLYIACKNGFTAIVSLLLEHRALVDLPTKTGETPLHAACINGHERICRMLVSRWANANSRDNNKRTPLYHAAYFGFASIVRCLLETKGTNGSDPNCRDQQGRSPLHVAALCGNLSVVQALCENNAEVDVEDVNGHTPLHYALKEHREDVADYLVGRRFSLEEKSPRESAVIKIDQLLVTDLHSTANNGLPPIFALFGQRANANATTDLRPTTQSNTETFVDDSSAIKWEWRRGGKRQRMQI